MERVERLTNLVALLLNTPRPRTLDEIAVELGYPDAYEARRAAFERDKRLLRDEGVPVETVALSGGGSGYRIDPDEYYLDVDLTEDERVALNLAMTVVRLEAGWSRDAAWKLGGVTGADAPALAFLPALDALPALFDGWRRRAPVSFSYRSKTRTLDPYGMLFRNGHWYVTGRDHANDEIRVYRADRIDGEVTTAGGDAFEPPAEFDPSDVLPGAGYKVGEGEAIAVDVLVDEPHAAAVAAELGEAAVIERRPGAVLFRVEATNLDLFRSWLFGLLDHAEVVAPEAVRVDVIERLEAMVSARTR